MANPKTIVFIKTGKPYQEAECAASLYPTKESRLEFMNKYGFEKYILR